jgi:hypothetical protein
MDAKDCAAMQDSIAMQGMAWMMGAGGLLWVLLLLLAVMGIAALAKYLFGRPRAPIPPP